MKDNANLLVLLGVAVAGYFAYTKGLFGSSASPSQATGSTGVLGVPTNKWGAQSQIEFQQVGKSIGLSDSDIAAKVATLNIDSLFNACTPARGGAGTTWNALTATCEVPYPITVSAGQPDWIPTTVPISPLPSVTPISLPPVTPVATPPVTAGPAIGTSNVTGHYAEVVAWMKAAAGNNAQNLHGWSYYFQQVNNSVISPELMSTIVSLAGGDGNRVVTAEQFMQLLGVANNTWTGLSGLSGNFIPRRFIHLGGRA